MPYTPVTDIAGANSAIADLYGRTDALLQSVAGGVTAAPLIIGGSRIYYTNLATTPVADYEQFVLLLHEVATGTAIDANYCNGTVFFSRGGTASSLRECVAIVDTASAYTTNTFGSCTSTGGQRACLKTCMYGGKKYICLTTDYSPARWSSCNFTGYARSTGEKLKIVPYYNEQTATILNAEINNSLADFTANTPAVNGNTLWHAGNFMPLAFNYITIAPTLYGSMTAGTPTYAVNTGDAWLIGNLVIMRFYINVSNRNTMAGSILMGNIPLFGKTVVTDSHSDTLRQKIAAPLGLTETGATGACATVWAGNYVSFYIEKGTSAMTAMTTTNTGSSIGLSGVLTYRVS